MTAAPWYLVTAIHHGMSVLGWMELQDDDQPPEQIWLDPEALSEHFETVKAKYRHGDAWESIEQPPMVENELARQMRGGRGK